MVAGLSATVGGTTSGTQLNGEAVSQAGVQGRHKDRLVCSQNTDQQMRQQLRRHVGHRMHTDTQWQKLHGEHSV